MLKRALGAVTVSAVSAAVPVLAASPAAANDLATPSPFVILRPDTYSAASCDFLFSGPSFDPARTPYHLEGSAVVVSRKVVVSTSLRCRLRLKDVTGKPQVGQTLARAVSGSVATVAGDVLVDRAGPFEICTWFDAVFSDTTRLNPDGVEVCRPLTNPLLASHAVLDPDPIYDPPIIVEPLPVEAEKLTVLEPAPAA